MRKRKLARTLLAAAILLPIPVTFTGPVENESLMPRLEFNNACGQGACCEYEPVSVCDFNGRPNYHEYATRGC
jgi:hypothetical protein